MVLAVCNKLPSDSFVWIDLFAVRQWPGSDADINFRPVIKLCKMAVVSVSPVEMFKSVINTQHERDRLLYETNEGRNHVQKTVPFFRLWCIVEIAACLKNDLEVYIQSGKSIKKGGNLYHYDTDCIEDLMSNLRHMIDIDRAAYSDKTDFDREMKYIEEQGIGVEDVNTIVTAAVIKAENRIQNERNAVHIRAATKA